MKEVKLMLMCVLLVGCQEVPTDKPIDNSAKIAMRDYGTVYNANNVQSFRIIEIDCCQYIYDGGMNTSVMTHKGNCPNPIHWQQSPDGQQALVMGDTGHALTTSVITIKHVKN